MPILLGLLVGLAAPVLVARTNARVRARLVQPLQALAWVLPRTPRDRAWFAALAVSAGICEELIDRGFLLGYLGGPAVGFGVPASVALATLVLLLGHTYQGWLGLLAVGVLGIVFTALYLLTGALWAPMLVHALVDLRILLFWPAPPADPETRPPPTRTAD
ncbi:MAG TPA: CPBP family intramembrane glutamic endopeptidase [Gemmatirosa sp.]